MKFLDLWQHSFHPGCQKSFLGVYMSSLRDVGIRRDITWRETFFEPWLKNFDLFLKTAFCVSERTFLVKIFFFEISVFFQTLGNFERTFTVLGEKVFGRDIKIEKCSFRLIRSTKNTNYWNFSLFIKLFRTLNEDLPCLAKKFWAGISKLKIAVFVSKDQSKNQTSESSLFFQTLQNFERTITVLGEKVLGRDIKIENCTSCLQSIMLGMNFFLNFCKFSFISDLEHKIFGFVATEFSPGLSEKLSRCL